MYTLKILRYTLFAVWYHVFLAAKPVRDFKLTITRYYYYGKHVATCSLVSYYIRHFGDTNHVIMLRDTTTIPRQREIKSIIVNFRSSPINIVFNTR